MNGQIVGASASRRWHIAAGSAAACVGALVAAWSAGGCGQTYLDGVLAPDASTSDGAAPDGASCHGDEVLCPDGCARLASDPLHCGQCDRRCSDGQVCSLGQCSSGCAGVLVDCSGSCVDTTTDENHCGGCNLPCSSEAECVGSECVCPGQADYCDGGCVNLENNHDNCGECGRRCDAGVQCVGGECQ